MSDLPKRIAITIAGLLVALVGVAGATMFVCVALYAFLQTLLPSYLAALCTAGLLLVLSLLVLAITGGIVGALRRQTRKSLRPSSNIIGAEIGKMLGEDAQAYIAKKPWMALVLAIGGGFLIGLSPRLRELLMKILKG